jgi:hypothetical protein
MDDLKPGDTIFTVGMVPCHVLWVSEIQFDVTYRLTFSDDSEIVAGARHKWYTRTETDNEWAVRTTQEIVDTLSHNGNPNHYVDGRCIVTATRIAPVPMRCIAVDAPSHLYLVGRSMIPTHNSDLLLGLARTRHRRSLLLRRTFPDLERSLISRSMEFFGPPNYYNGSKHVWTVGKVRCEFGHMDNVGSPQVPGDEASYASAPYDLIAFDQLEQFPQYAYEFMISRARSAVPGQRVQIVASANPIGENIDWLIRRWAPWLDESHPNPAKSGELRYYKRNPDGLEVETTEDDPDALSRTFIAAGLKDNPYLGDDYRRTLNLLPEPLRSALLNGDWKASITDDAYQVIPRSWVKLAQQRWQPQPPGPITALGVDVARGGMDQTVLSAGMGSGLTSYASIPA